jgi:hypothetical protein
MTMTDTILRDAPPDPQAIEHQRRKAAELVRLIRHLRRRGFSNEAAQVEAVLNRVLDSIPVDACA